MIIPLIFSLDSTNLNMPFLWSFYKGISFSKRYSWPVIAQERYFSTFQQQKEEFPFFFQSEVCEKFEYECPEEADLKKITKVIFPAKIEEAFIKKYPSQTDAYLASMTTAWPEMEVFLEEALKYLEQLYEEKIEAIMMLQSCKFIDNVTTKLGIPVIHYEWGPMRYDVYRNTAYFDWEGIGGDSCFYKRYQEFSEKGYEKVVPVFSKNELLALFLNSPYLHYATDTRPEPSYKIGLAFGYTNPGVVTARTSVSPIELYNKVRNYYSEKDIAIRYHPGDPMHADIRKPNVVNGSLIDFILKCERLACVGSNVSFEAMLYGKYVYEEKWSHYGIICNHLEDGMTDKIPCDLVLNFVLFNVLVPYELLNSVEYIRFRLNEKDEKNIYLYHLRYYLNILGIEQSILELDAEDRLTAILSARKGKKSTEKEYIVSDYIDGVVEKTFPKEIAENILLEQKKNQIIEMAEHIDKITDESKKQYEELVNTNALLQKEQEYSRSLLEGISFRDEQLKKAIDELEEEREYSKSLMSGIMYRDEQINQTNEELEKERNYSKSLMSGIVYRDDNIVKLENDKRTVENQHQRLEEEKCQLELKIKNLEEEVNLLKVNFDNTKVQNEKLQNELESILKYSLVAKIRKTLNSD